MTMRNENDNRSPDRSLEKKAGEHSLNDEVQPMSQLQLFRYANRFEIFLMFLGVTCAIATGMLMPVAIFTFSSMSQVMVDEKQKSANATAYNSSAPTTTAVIDAITLYVIQNTIMGAGMLVLVYMSTMLFNYTSQQQTFRIRQMYMKSILHQDMSWYDHNVKSGSVATELTDSIIKIEEGIGEKFAICLDQLAVSIFCIGFSFYCGWKLTLVSLASFPITGIVLGIVGRISSFLTRKEVEAFGSASNIAEEALSGIKTVVAFDGQNSELERYKESLNIGYKINNKIGIVSGCGFGLFWLGIYTNYAISQGYGVALILDQKHLPIEEKEYDVSVMIMVFFCTVIAAMNIGTASPYIEIFSASRAAATKIFSVIERKSDINSLYPGGAKIKDYQGAIEFKNVEFCYPTRLGVQVLQKLSFGIERGQTVALVGSSGCGKSTCIQLLQRFYDPISGQILLDGHDLRDLNIAWLRSVMCTVSQEPVLFDMTIAENIRYGNLDATIDMVIRAAKESNAHDFIIKLPLKYDTLVGEKGAKLSGGQKQRIAIARALIRDPLILLLDEATSALDTQSESKIQDVLEKIHKGRTTIIVAHRLSTIRSADKIIVLSNGHVVEEGRHDELMALNAQYHALVTAQVTNFVEPEHPRSTVAKIEQIDENFEPITTESELRHEVYNSKTTTNKVGMWKVIKLNKPEWKLLLIAGAVSVAVGSSTPLFAILFGDIIEILTNVDDSIVRYQSNIYAIYFVAAGVAIGVSTCLQIFLLTVVSERLTTRLRALTFQAMLKQEMAWFDEPSNGTGALCSKLSTETAAVKGATGQCFGTIMQSFSALIISIGISIYYEWRLGLMGVSLIPFMIFIIILHGRVCNKETLDYHKDLEKSTKIAVEVISNIKTVVGLGGEEKFYENYVKTLTPSYEQATKNAHCKGIIFGLFRSVGYFVFCAIIYYGGVLVQKGEMEYSSVFIVGQALVTGTVAIGQASAFSSNLLKGITAAAKIISLIERVPKILDSNEPKEHQSMDDACVNFDTVSFNYPTRPSVTALKTVNFTVTAGKTMALVGPSGCGKSTIIKLLERFYDPDSGTVEINAMDVASVKQSSLRMLLGLVEQEPTTFARTIQKNIAYGNNTRNVSIEEVIVAAKQANIHNFIVSLPLGYETILGNKGTMLSGGQKQRIAIARALVRNPKVLLLDEATSALDTESEKVVQAALDKAKIGRTCIVIAHRLSTVENADAICVLNHGSVIEYGNHEELVRNSGLYYEMLRLQNMFMKSSPDTASRVSVWKRYNDFKKLHADLKILHETLEIRESYPSFPKPKFFGRFEAEVIEERRECAVKFLEFLAKHVPLFTNDVFVTFFETSLGDDTSADCSRSVSSDNTSEDDKSTNNSSSVTSHRTVVTERLPNLSPNLSPNLISPNQGTTGKGATDNGRVNGPIVNGALLDSSIDNEFKILNNNYVEKNSEDMNWQEFLSVEKLLESGKNDTLRRGENSVIMHDDPTTSLLSDTGQDSGRYILIGAAHMSAGFRHEAIAEYEEAFMQYKLGISNLGQGVQKDPNYARTATIKDKIMKYSERADRLYNRHLNCNISMISKPVSDLRYYKVMRVMGSVMLVNDLHRQTTRVIKTVEKPAGVQEDISKYILRGKVPYMVQLHACVQTETTVFLILQYASGGKLWELVKKQYAVTCGRVSSRKKIYARSTSCEAVIDLNSERRMNTSLDRSHGGEAVDADKTQLLSYPDDAKELFVGHSTEDFDTNAEDSVRKLQEESGANSACNKDTPTTKLLEKAQKLLKSVDATIKKSNSMATRLNESGRLLYETEATNETKETNESDNTQGSSDLSELSMAADSCADLGAESDKTHDPVDRVVKRAIFRQLSSSKSPEIEEEQQSTRKSRAIDGSIFEETHSDERFYHDEDSGIEMEQELWRIPEIIIKTWAAQLLLTLEALHQQEVVISDLRPDNLLVDDDGRILLSYVVPRQCPELSRYKKPYTAPELCMYLPVVPATPAADVWSFGVLLYELFTGIPFQSRHPGPFHSHSIISIPNEVSETARLLLTKILTFDPSKRLTIPEIKQLPFFEKTDWLSLLNA